VTFPRRIYHPTLGNHIAQNPSEHEAALSVGWSDSPIRVEPLPKPATIQSERKLLEAAYVERDQLKTRVSDLEREAAAYQATIADLTARVEAVEKPKKAKKADGEPA
jgi:hypothetical protein